MADQDEKKTFIFRSYVNSFWYLYRDAEYLHRIARGERLENTPEKTQLCRTALLLYILSLEGLINRAMAQFLPESLRDFFLEREDKFNLKEKLLLLPLLVSNGRSQFDTSNYPWNYFSELVQLRNDFVHPKHDRAAYYRAVTSHIWEPLPWNEIPQTLGVKETQVVYRQTRIPKDPYAIRLEHVDVAKQVVDDVISRLDQLVAGKILEDNWHQQDQMQLIYPPGATLDDLSQLDAS